MEEWWEGGSDWTRHRFRSSEASMIPPRCGAPRVHGDPPAAVLMRRYTPVGYGDAHSRVICILSFGRCEPARAPTAAVSVDSLSCRTYFWRAAAAAGYAPAPAACSTHMYSCVYSLARIQTSYSPRVGPVYCRCTPVPTARRRACPGGQSPTLTPST